MRLFEKEDEILQLWKNQVLRTLLIVIVIFGVIAYIPSIILAIQEKFLYIIILDTAALLLVIFLLFTRLLDYKIKVLLLLFGIYSLGIGLLIFLGPYGAGFVWLVGFPIISAILLNQRTAYLAILFNFFTVVTLGILINLDFFRFNLISTYSTETWIVNSINMLCITIIAVYPITVIVSNLKNKLKEEHLMNIQKQEMVKKLEKKERSLKSKNQQLKKVNQELDNFIYRVSHNLRSPLTSILGLIHLSKKETDSVQKSLYLDYISKSANKLDRFIKDLINFTRNSRLEVSIEPINFASMIDSVLEDLRYLENYKKIKFQKDITGLELFYSDTYRLKIIFSNLISNAIKYSWTKNRQAYVLIQIKVLEEKVFIAVEDNGIGIEQEQLPLIFNMFYRANESVEGTGLGLYIVNEIVQKLSGNIEVESTINQGSRFKVFLPNHKQKDQKY